MFLGFLFPPIKSRCQGTMLWACWTQHNCFLIYCLSFSAFVERPICFSSSNPLDFLQFQQSLRYSLSLSLSFFLSVWLSPLVHFLVLALSWQVFETEFYKANKRKNLHRENGALIELSKTNLPRDSVWQKLHPKHRVSVSARLSHCLQLSLSLTFIQFQCNFSSHYHM